MGAGGRHGQCALIASGDIDQNDARGFCGCHSLQVAREVLWIWGRNRDGGWSRFIIAKPARDRAVVVEVDDVNNIAGMGKGAGKAGDCR